MNVTEMFEICNRFRKTTKKNEKKALLEEYQDNTHFRDFVKCTIDPLIKYGLQEKKIKKFESARLDVDKQNMTLADLFDHLAVNNTGADKEAELVAGFINLHEDPMERRFILQAVTKKVRLGVTENTVNEVWGKGFISKFSIMLAKKFEDESHKLDGQYFGLTEKFDGQRAVFIKQGPFITVKSREGSPLSGFVEIEAALRNPTLPDGVYDGELLCKNHEELRDRDVLQQTLKITKKNGDKTDLIFYLFDYLTLEEFENEKSDKTYHERRELLHNIFTLVNEPTIYLIPLLYVGNDLSVIPPMLAQLEELGKEGLMLNLLEVPYECKRSSNILKLKTMQTADLKVIGFEAGKALGKYEHTLGTMFVDYKGFPLGVSGFTDSEREEIWNKQEDFIGKIAEIQYFRESKNENGGVSVSFPQFKGFRDDKLEPSYH